MDQLVPIPCYSWQHCQMRKWITIYQNNNLLISGIVPAKLMSRRAHGGNVNFLSANRHRGFIRKVFIFSQGTKSKGSRKLVE